MICYGSSSKGNGYLLEGEKETLLIEAGLPISRVRKAVPDWSKVVGCLISHRHSDHTKSMADIMKSGVDVYANEDVWEWFKEKGSTFNKRVLEAGYTREIGEFKVMPFEANHDVRMLQVGPYPYFLKRRILSDHGHLSNENAGRFLAGLCSPRLRTVVLSHISKTNNYRELALEGVGLELMEIDAAMRPRLILAPEAGLSEIIEIPG